MYSEEKIVYDKTNKISCQGKLDTNAVIYRLASPSYANVNDAFSGEGSVHSSNASRFNSPQQLAVYCSNNILLCISEILFHNYRTTLNLIHENHPAEVVRNKIHDKRALIIAKTTAIDNLVYIDSKDFIRDYRITEVQGTWVVHPDVTYEPYHTISNKIRNNQKSGIIYPSARHSEDIAIVFFKNISDLISNDDYHLLEVNLHLISEEISPEDCGFEQCDPNYEKLHFTMGYFSFENQDLFYQLKEANYINPSQLKPYGMIDFVRRKYRSYPNDAIVTDSVQLKRTA